MSVGSSPGLSADSGTSIHSPGARFTRVGMPVEKTVTSRQPRPPPPSPMMHPFLSLYHALLYLCHASPSLLLSVLRSTKSWFDMRP